MVLEKQGKKFLMLVAVFMLAGMLAAGVGEEGVKDARPSGLLAGVAKVNIDPAVGIPHQNWGSATHIVANGLDPAGMFVRALVLSDGKQKFALVDVDAEAWPVWTMR
jgi:hypothetical protein